MSVLTQYDMSFYIYIYLDPRKPGKYIYGNYCFLYEPFYIGKGKGYRYKNIKWNRTNYFNNKINKILKCGLKPIVFKLYKNLSESESLKLENKLINSIGRKDLNKGPLVNLTDGGDGSSGWVYPNELLEKYKKDYLYIENEFRKKNYKLLTKKEEYKNNKQKLKYICSEGHICYISWNNFQQGQLCYKCSKKLLSKKLRKSFEDIKREFKKRKCILLSKKENYINAQSKLKYMCPFGNEHFISWGNFQQGHRCNCYRKKIYNSLKYIPLSKIEVNSNDDPTLETISLTIYVAGCVRRCIGCQNPELQEINKRNHKLLTTDQVKEIINSKLCLIKSICFCGGDFLPLYKRQLVELVDFCKLKELKTILYTGELYENINDYIKNSIDIIVDGPYNVNYKTNKFPASSNQRVWINSKLVDPDELMINKIYGFNLN